MPNIQDLPLEVIGQVVSIAYPGEPPADGDEWRARRAFLRTTSLVCGDWRPFAQAELWKFVHLRWKEIERFAVAGPGRHPVLTLVLVQNAFSDTGLTEKILLGVRGVRKLEIMLGQFDSGCLCGPGFRDLKSLILNRAWDRRENPVSLPFHLKKLELHIQTQPTQLLHALSQQSTITSLSVRGYAEDVTSLLPLAPSLLACEVYQRQVGLGNAETEDFLSKCTQLKHLNLFSDNLDCVDSVVTSLKTLKIELLDQVDTPLILDLLNSEPAALKALERLTVHAFDGGVYRSWLAREELDREWEGWEEWSETEEFCRQKKIELAVTGVDDKP